MDTERMLKRCLEGQWSASDLSWDVPPREMSAEEERAIVQYFTDMAEIERFAAALFEEQRRIVDDPTLKRIFASFVVDEKRHSEVALRLARHYDVHTYRKYTPSPGLKRFKPQFL